MRYGPPNPDYVEGAEWLQRFMRRNDLSEQRVALIVGMNQARVWEWLHQRRALPSNVQNRLERWESDGGPTFPYWHDIPAAA